MITSTIEKNVLYLTITDRFTFEVHVDFRRAVEQAKNVSKVIVNLKRCTYMDSSALGMMLVLRDSNMNVVLQDAQSDVAKVLYVANFDKLFKIT